MESVAIVTPEGAAIKQWDYALSSLPVASLRLIGAPVAGRGPLAEAAVVHSAEQLPGELVVVSPRTARYIHGTESLTDYLRDPLRSPTFLFGPDHLPLSTDHLGARVPDRLVYISTASRDDLFSHVAFVICWVALNGVP